MGSSKLLFPYPRDYGVETCFWHIYTDSRILSEYESPVCRQLLGGNFKSKFSGPEAVLEENSHFYQKKPQGFSDIKRKVIGFLSRKAVGGIFKTAFLASSDTSSGKLFFEKLSAGLPQRHVLCLEEHFKEFFWKRPFFNRFRAMGGKLQTGFPWS